MLGLIKYRLKSCGNRGNVLEMEKKVQKGGKIAEMAEKMVQEHLKFDYTKLKV